jgi:hypothetical protein
MCIDPEEVQLLKLQLVCPDFVLRTSKTFLEVSVVSSPTSSKRRSKSAQPLGRRGLEHEDDLPDVQYYIEPPECVSDKTANLLFSLYLSTNNMDGATLMWREVPMKWGLMELTEVLMATKTRDVAYLYLPMNHTANRKVTTNRNKRYAFIHFTTVRAAQRFATAIRSVHVNGKGQMYASIAKHQGIMANLDFLFDVPDKKKLQMLRSNLCAFLDPTRSDSNSMHMVTLLFSTLRTAMLAKMQKGEACSAKEIDTLESLSTAEETDSWRGDV